MGAININDCDNSSLIRLIIYLEQELLITDDISHISRLLEPRYKLLMNRFGAIEYGEIRESKMNFE